MVHIPKNTLYLMYTRLDSISFLDCTFDYCWPKFTLNFGFYDSRVGFALRSSHFFLHLS